MTRRSSLHLTAVLVALAGAAGLTLAGCSSESGCEGTTNADGVTHCNDGAVNRTYAATCSGKGGDCSSDADCKPSQVCMCEDEANVCIEAKCRIDADCPSGECGLVSFQTICLGTLFLACRTDADTCRTNTDCDPSGGHGCLFEEGKFQCDPEAGQVCVGRPFLVEERARTAAVVARQGWTAPADRSLGAELGNADREALAVYWAGVAAMEHASVASFARFTLELLALGAPVDLVTAAQRAGADEVRHAALAFGLASRYGRGPTLGPAALSMRGLTVAEDPRRVIDALVEEACVGETIAAAQVLASANSAVDEDLRATLLVVHADETRHAALGWATLRWLIDHPAVRSATDDGDASLAAHAIERLERAIERAAAAVPIPRRAVPSHGLVSAAEEQAVTRAALRDVVRPLILGLRRTTLRAA